LAGKYGRIVDTVKEILSSQLPSVKTDIFGGTAKRFYRLNI